MRQDNNHFISHFGTPGMKWGVRRAAKLSAKYGVKVGEGIKEREVKGALNKAAKTKEFLRNDLINTYANNSTSYFLTSKV